jgi:hypothetical protein
LSVAASIARNDLENGLFTPHSASLSHNPDFIVNFLVEQNFGYAYRQIIGDQQAAAE